MLDLLPTIAKHFGPGSRTRHMMCLARADAVNESGTSFASGLCKGQVACSLVVLTSSSEPLPPPYLLSILKVMSDINIHKVG